MNARPSKKETTYAVRLVEDVVKDSMEGLDVIPQPIVAPSLAAAAVNPSLLLLPPRAPEPRGVW